MYNLFTGAIVPDVSLPSVVVAIVKPVLKSKLSVLDDDVFAAEQGVQVFAPLVGLGGFVGGPQVSVLRLHKLLVAVIWGFAFGGSAW